MAFARASALRGAWRAVRPSQASVGRAQQWRQIGRRGYASHGHGSQQSSSDLPWLAGAIAVTVPSCWYLINNGPEADHGHGGHDDEHDEGHDKEHGDEHDDEGAKDESESENDNKSDETGDDSDGGDENKDTDTPDTSEDEGGENEKGGKSTDETSSETPATPKGEKKVIADSKGGNKKRTDGEKGQKQGKPEDMVDGGATESKDKPAASKTAGGRNTQSGKQEGLSNTDTKTSVDVTNNSEKSTKGEGSPETSKTKGTVDPKRPQA